MSSATESYASDGALLACRSNSARGYKRKSTEAMPAVADVDRESVLEARKARNKESAFRSRQKCALVVPRLLMIM